MDFLSTAALSMVIVWHTTWGLKSEVWNGKISMVQAALIRLIHGNRGINVLSAGFMPLRPRVIRALEGKTETLPKSLEYMPMDREERLQGDHLREDYLRGEHLKEDDLQEVHLQEAPVREDRPREARPEEGQVKELIPPIIWLMYTVTFISLLTRMIGRMCGMTAMTIIRP